MYKRAEVPLRSHKLLEYFYLQSQTAGVWRQSGRWGGGGGRWGVCVCVGGGVRGRSRTAVSSETILHGNARNIMDSACWDVRHIPTLR